MNAPDRFELFLLPDGVQKVTVSADQRMPNAAFIKFEREDHTLGNMLTVQLQQDPRVLYAAYKVEHPLFANFVMRVQTEDGYSPREALRNACQSLIGQLKKATTYINPEDSRSRSYVMKRFMSGFGTVSNAYGPIETKIRQKLMQLKPEVLEIANDSQKHAHHAGMRGSSNTIESHFRISIVSPEFESISKPMRHRMVYKLLAEEMQMPNGVHAVQLSTKTPAEVEAARKPILDATN